MHDVGHQEQPLTLLVPRQVASSISQLIDLSRSASSFTPSEQPNRRSYYWALFPHGRAEFETPSTIS